jgi:hypothetical protein
MTGTYEWDTTSYPPLLLTTKNLPRWVRWAGCFGARAPYIYICVPPRCPSALVLLLLLLLKLPKLPTARTALKAGRCAGKMVGNTLEMPHADLRQNGGKFPAVFAQRVTIL